MAPKHVEIDFSHQSVIGVDEAGRGCLAGPVVAAAVMLDSARPISGLNDSKKLSEKARETLYEHIYAQALCVHVKAIDAPVIDRINILQASLRAMREAVMDAIKVRPADLILVDGNQPIANVPVEQKTVIGGDGLVECIMAASIVAKVHRDRLMKELDGTFPGYGFAKHKGYGTKAHLAAIERLGPVAIHRMSYAPLKAYGAC